MKHAATWGLLLFVSVACAQAHPPESRSAIAFKKLRSLAGEWEGKDARGHGVKTVFKSIVSDTALMETLTPPGMEDMITIYSLDGNAISLVHYCPTNNQPRMRAIPAPGAVNELDFEFTGAGNLASPAAGHEHRLLLRFEDDSHFTETWTWRQNGRDSIQVYHFTRKSR
jgi:hypothetical protein